MAHEVESMSYYGEMPWHGLGNKIDHCDDLDEMLVAAGIDWEVELRAIWEGSQIRPNDLGEAIPGFWALTRKTDGKVFDIVGDRYTPMQNREVMEFFRDFVEAGDATMETMGSLRGGKYVWGLANLHANFTLPGNDKVNNYLLVGKPHEQGKSAIFRRTAIRVVCQNTLTMALSDRHAMEYHMAHRRKFKGSDAERAREVLALAREDSYSFEQDAKKLLELELTIEQVLDIIVPIMSPNATKDQVKAIREGDYTPRIEKVMESYHGAPGAMPGSGWGVLNAITHYSDHVASRTIDQRMTNAWFGKTARQKTLVLSELLAMAA